MKVYVASHCRWAACHVAQVLAGHGHSIVSSWHNQEFLRGEEMTEDIKRLAANRDLREIAASDAVCLIAGPDKYPGGKFVEAGFALGAGKSLCVIGRLENVVLFADGIKQLDTPHQAALWLSQPKEQ